jgi:hypothetical protein
MHTANQSLNLAQEGHAFHAALHSITLRSRAAHPAPVVYGVLGNLKTIGHFLPESCAQLAQGLVKSLDDYDVTEGDGTDPAASIMSAREHLSRAAKLAEQLGTELAKAQEALAGQAYRIPGDPRRDSDGG